MKILYPTTDKEATFDSPLEPVLGNAKAFFIYDTQPKKWLITNSW